MIKATGITAEYNPLHNGHVFHMEEARRLTGCDALVVAMSGDYVQRGEPAISDKWARTGSALASGADLVVEIPVICCLGDAGRYASAGVSLLEALGCSNIAFGSESADADQLVRTADFLCSNKKIIADIISDLTSDGMSYPAARAEAVSRLGGDVHIPETPNDILALEYVMSMKHAVPVPVKRSGSGYNDPLTEGRGYQSAAAVRDILREGGDDALDKCRVYVPEASHKMLADTGLTFPDDWTNVLRYSVMSMSPDEIEACPSGGEGLANLLKKAVMEFDTWYGIISAVKSKRYTYTRISRLCMQVVIGISRDKFTKDKPLYIRVLGFTDKGRQLLSEIKRKADCPLPVITNINRESGLLDDEAAAMLRLDVHAADIYNLVTGRDTREFSDHRMGPVQI